MSGEGILAFQDYFHCTLWYFRLVLGMFFKNQTASTERPAESN